MQAVTTINNHDMAELGNTRRVYIVTGDGKTYTVLKGEQSNSVNRSAESIDIPFAFRPDAVL